MKLIILLTAFFVAGIGFHTNQRYRGCFFRKQFSMAGSVKDKYQLIALPPTDPLYTVTTQEIMNIQSCFLVAPIFFYYDDKDGNNAMATDEILQPNGPDGTVLFGKRFFNREFIKTYGGTTIPMIMAHEYAHILDYKFGALQNAGSKRSELFADFMAGLYMQWRVYHHIITDVNACLESFRSMGDTDFGNVDTHGSPTERYNALKKGYDTGMAYAARGVTINLNQAIEIGKAYIRTIPVDDKAKTPE